MNRWIPVLLALSALITLGCQSASGGTPEAPDDSTMTIVPALDAAAQADLTPDSVLQRLQDGNQRFVENRSLDRDLLAQVEQTSTGQHPAAVVLSCIDSRVPAEIVFDQGIGDIFSARVAGNIVDEHTLGSMEFATKVAGSKLVVVMGHTSCGAVKGACDGVDLGHVTSLVTSIQPSVEALEAEGKTCTSKKADVVNEVATHNVARTIEEIRERSTILAEMEQAGEIRIVGAMYDVSTGAVTFF